MARAVRCCETAICSFTSVGIVQQLVNDESLYQLLQPGTVGSWRQLELSQSEGVHVVLIVQEAFDEVAREDTASPLDEVRAASTLTKHNADVIPLACGKNSDGFRSTIFRAEEHDVTRAYSLCEVVHPCTLALVAAGAIGH